MRILISSHAFHPSIGGLERSAELLAEQFCQAGHQVTVVTTTASRDDSWDQRQAYRIVRRPSLPQRWRLLLQADLVHANGASLALALPALLLRKPLVITHQGYQLVSVDGLGWGSEGPTPLLPQASLAYYRSRLPRLRWLRQVVLLSLRRWVGHHATTNVAITHWVASRQPLPRQVVIHNPVALPAVPNPEAVPSAGNTIPWDERWDDRPVDCLFLGRLVQEKGLDVLLRTLHTMAEQHQGQPTLLVVGDGPMREPWMQLTEQLGLSAHVQFAGSLRGEALARALRQARIGVVPSVWEEPMGLVAIEMLAAGLVPVVSAEGGLAECVGDAGVSVPNGDPQALAAALADLLNTRGRSSTLRAKADERLAAFTPQRIAAQYLAVFAAVVTQAATAAAGRPTSTDS